MTKQDIIKLKESTVQKEKQLANEQFLISQIKIAYNSMNDKLATYLIQKPKKIKPLLGDKKNSLLLCKTAMHALAISLFNTECHDVLNDMTNEDIEALSKCISIAKNYNTPDITKLHEAMEQRRQNTANSYEAQETNKAMISSLELQAQLIENKDWDSAVKELDKWSDAIQNFVRTPKQQKEEIKMSYKREEVTFLTIDELANKMGITKAQLYTFITHSKKRLGLDFEKYFHKTNNRLFFNACSYKEFKAIYENRNTKPGRKPQNKQNGSLSQPVATKKTEIKQTVTTNQQDTSNLLDIKALSAYVNKLVELLNVANNELVAAKTKSQELRNMLATEQDEEKVTKLLLQATETNADVQQKKQNVNAINEKHNVAQKLLQDYNDAKKLFMDVQQEIKTFMKSTQNQHQ